MVKTKGLKRFKRSGEDWVSRLPDELLCEILKHLCTKDTVRTSVLSKRWKNLWLDTPALDLEYNQFEDDCVFSEFIDTSIESRENLGVNVERFRLVYDAEEHDHDDFVWRIDTVIKRKVTHLTIVNRLDVEEDMVRMPLSLYSCATLVSVSLSFVVLDAPEPETVFSLPCLKNMHLEQIKYDGSCVLETFISSCPVLEELEINAARDENFLEDICVRSQSLRSFTLGSPDWVCENPDVELDAPKLEYLSINDYHADNFIIHSIGTSAKVNIDMIFSAYYDDPSERVIIISDFFAMISTIREMIISARTLEFIRGYFKSETLPQFCNLSHLDASFTESSWELFPMFLGCCPSLHHLVLEFNSLRDDISLSYVPQCFPSTLEFVELKTPSKATQTSSMMKLAIYFVRNCATLKMLMVSESFGEIMTKIKRIPKRSEGCKIFMV